MVLTYIRPDADDTDGGWTDEGGATTLFDHIDESSATDSDYIQSSNSPDHDIVKLRLSDPSVALLQRPVTIRYRYRKKGDPNQSMNLTATLLQGSTEIASWTHTDISSDFATAEQALTADQFAAISDFTDLFIQFDAYSDWWLVDSYVDMDFEADLYHVEEPDEAHFLMHGDLVTGESDGSTVIIDSTGRHPITVVGSTQIDTAQSKFGGSSVLFNGSTDYLTLDGSTDFNFGTGDFAIDFWVRFNSVASDLRLFASNVLSASPDAFHITMSNASGNKLTMYVGSLSNTITGTTTITTGTWYHVELSRVSGSSRLFLNGTQEGSTYTDSNNYILSATYPQIGCYNTGNQPHNGWLDEFRILKAAGHTSTFTPPTLPYSVAVSGPYAHLKCTRSTTGYATNSDGTLTSFAANTLRIGSGTGLLVEDSRTNVFTQSQDLSHADWGNAQSSESGGNTAPDGTSTAYKIIPDTTTNSHDMRKVMGTTSSGVTKAISFYGKASGYKWLYLDVYDGTDDCIVKFDLSNGSTSTVSNSGWTSLSSSTEALANSWYRCTVIGTGDGTGGTLYFVIRDNSETSVYAGDGTSGIQIWGVQVENNVSFPSSYIPTTSASVTRSADLVEFLGGPKTIIEGNYNQSAVVDAISDYTISSGATTARLIDAGAVTRLAGRDTNTAWCFDSVAFEEQAVFASGLWTTGAKAGYSQGPSGISLVGNGGTVQTDPDHATDSPTRLGRGWYGYIRRAVIWSSKLADATLQSYTDPGTTLSFPVDSNAKIDFNFAGGQYYAQPAATDFLSCSRASTGYAKTAAGELVNFAANQLRITDAGLLVEDSRTNLLWPSEDASSVQYTNKNLAVTTNAATAPNGAATMDKLDDGAIAGNHNLSQQQNSASTVTVSAFVKDVDRRYVIIAAGENATGGGAAAVFDLQTGTKTQSGTVGSGGTHVASDIESFSGGVYRIWVAASRASATNFYAVVNLSDTSTPTLAAYGEYSYTGSNKSIYVWGLQMENASFPSSYIPTTSSSATRAADVVTTAGAFDAIFGLSTASVVTDVNSHRTASGSSSIRIIGRTDSTVALKYWAGATSETSLGTYNGVGAELFATLGGGTTFPAGTKVGVAWNTSGPARSLVGGGGTVATDALVTNSLAGRVTAIGRYSSGSSNEQWYGYFHRLTGWSTKLADATLQGHTAP